MFTTIKRPRISDSLAAEIVIAAYLLQAVR